MKGKLLSGIRLKKKLFSISAIIVILCLIPMFVIWTSAQVTPPELPTLIIDVTGDFRGKGNCLQASSGKIDAWLPPTYNYDPVEKSIGGVTWDVSYGYNFGSSQPTTKLALVEDIMIHIHIAGSFRRLNEFDSADITMLMIHGFTATPTSGAQYSVNAYSETGYLGEVIKTGSNTWSVVASIPDSEQSPIGLCVTDWVEGQVVEGFCIPLHFDVAVEGTITK